MSNKDVLLVTSWVFPHIGGVSSHLQLLASKLQLSESDVLSFRDISEEPKVFWKRFFNRVEKLTRRILEMETISLLPMNLNAH
jgi:hypothetical protein